MGAAALSMPAASQAAAPCWERVLEDWRDGRIDGEYAVQCYREALSRLPEDLRVYSSAESDIQRALSQELAERPRRAQAPSPTPAVTTPPAPHAARRTTRKTKAAVAPRPKRRTLAMQTPKEQTPRREAAPPTSPSNSTNGSSFPVRLVVVLGGAAVVAAVALASWRRAALRRARQEP